jgi:hypothetical protein
MRMNMVLGPEEKVKAIISALSIDHHVPTRKDEEDKIEVFQRGTWGGRRSSEVSASRSMSYQGNCDRTIPIIRRAQLE